MTRITGQIVIDAPADMVFDFAAASGMSRPATRTWCDPRRSRRGPVGKGTQFRSAVRSRGRLAEMAIEYTRLPAAIPAGLDHEDGGGSRSAGCASPRRMRDSKDSADEDGRPSSIVAACGT
jgi:hypothetical protein